MDARLVAADAAGHGPRVRALVDGGLWESARDDDELMLWAADYGAYALIHHRLEARTTRPMLEIVRAWVDRDPVTELRRRLGAPEGVVERRIVPIDEFSHTECVRVTATDGRWAEVQTAHVAIMTYIEEALGVGASRDELMARALRDGDPESITWSECWLTVAGRRDVAATVSWANAVLEGQDPAARRFADQVLTTGSVADFVQLGDVVRGQRETGAGDVLP